MSSTAVYILFHLSLLFLYSLDSYFFLKIISFLNDTYINTQYRFDFTVFIR